MVSFSPNAARLMRYRFVLQMDNESNHTEKATQGEEIASSSLPPDLNSAEHAFHLLWTHKDPETSCGKDLTKIIWREETHHLVMCMGSKLQMVTERKGFSSSIKDDP